jgi:hypothetical protein
MNDKAVLPGINLCLSHTTLNTDHNMFFNSAINHLMKHTIVIRDKC